MIRLGLCCTFFKQPIHFHTARATYVKKLENPRAYLSNVVRNNSLSLQAALAYCARQGIGSFRVTSEFLPLVTYPGVAYAIDDLEESSAIRKDLETCRRFAQTNGIRLTLHPDQFVVLNSPHPSVVKSSLGELEYHGRLARLLGADVITLHAGGVYGDRKAALRRLYLHLQDLSFETRKLLALENDDKCFTPSDLLPLCRHAKLPFVYDVHHHRCLPDALSIEEATQQAIATWKREPLFHISSPLEGWKKPRPFRHASFIHFRDFPAYWLQLKNLFTLEVEAKAKEVAVLRLRKALLQRGVALYPCDPLV